MNRATSTQPVPAVRDVHTQIGAKLQMAAPAMLKIVAASASPQAAVLAVVLGDVKSDHLRACISTE
jgi:hypothetical protein